MSPDDDWIRWSNAWQRQPPVDVPRLQRRVRRKLWQMRAMVAWRLIGCLVAVVLVVRLQLMPNASSPLKVWAALMLLLIAAFLYFRLRIYRGTWRPANDSVPDLLRLTAKRAKAGIRLASVNVACILTITVVSLLMAEPWLTPAGWRHDSALRQLLIPLIAVGSVYLAFNVLYMRRQRRRLRGAEALLGEESDEDASR
ncbi:MAG: hypothetical protein ACREPY_15940 [Rhodanobacteraceae bacterium]